MKTLMLSIAVLLVVDVASAQAPVPPATTRPLAAGGCGEWVFTVTMVDDRRAP